MAAREGLAARVRADFPVTETGIYLNANSTGPIPRPARAVLDRWWTDVAGWRDEVWERWWHDLGAFADAVASLLGGTPGSVVTDGSVSSLLGRLATCFDWRGPRRRVVLTDLEFPTVPFLWRACTRLGVEPVLVRSRDGRRVAEEDLCAAIDERVRLVCVSHAFYGTGALLDVEPVAKRAHAAGALLVLDAYQSVGTVPIDAPALGVDVLLAGAHKWLCGSPELAFAWIRPSLIASLEPAATGWIAAERPLAFGAAERWAPDARRLASGTPAVLPALLSRPGLDLIASVGLAAIRSASLARTERVIARALEAGLEVVTPREDARRGGVVVLRFEGDARVHAALLQRGIVTSHRGGIRIAPHLYNTDDEIERAMDTLVELARREAS